MTQAIYKYRIDGPDVDLELPAGATLLALQMQNGDPHLWVLLDPEAPLVTRRFRTLPTGTLTTPLPAGSTYVGTFQMAGGLLVFHLFEIP